MDNLLLVEKSARALDEAGRIPFSEEDILRYIKEKFKKDISIEKVKDAVEILSVSSKRESPVRKCIYKEKEGGYSYLHACSFGVS
ncbi:hypothetical protein [Hippea maritima]|uniref:Uncharacterized protein n=1 Tax=Hippea maritima (strain ATCC 700847 / DSM 10411 / MH2) TaxID=760142 RepID=F2LX74_HIPMA|nr:hypothetical protein [Hippea maritima]AEA33132.1 hypothetical protein Hipma_0153 [Hippea maritima DSM 10411]